MRTFGMIGRRGLSGIGLVVGLGLLAGCSTPGPTLESTKITEAAEVKVVAEVKVETLPVATADVKAEADAVGAGPVAVRPGTPLARAGDEIMVAGQLFHTGTPVVLWTDAGGYDGYRVERRYAALERSGWTESKADVPALGTPNRYGMRAAVLSAKEQEQVRGGGWDLGLLQKVVDQFVLHYDAAGTSRRCFERLHDDRGLSIHFMLDVDGTIYQTLDLKERAWHATVANSRSIGIEIANVGAYAPEAPAGAKLLAEWYAKTGDDVRMTIPVKAHPEAVRTANFVGRPDRAKPVDGMINGAMLRQYDFTPEQYAALTRLTAAVCAIFPKLACDYPRDEGGRLVTTTLSEAQWTAFHGVIGHYHIQTNKIDPGPAMQWARVINGARALLALRALPEPLALPEMPVKAAPAQVSPPVEPNTSKPLDPDAVVLESAP